MFDDTPINPGPYPEGSGVQPPEYSAPQPPAAAPDYGTPASAPAAPVFGTPDASPGAPSYAPPQTPAYAAPGVAPEAPAYAAPEAPVAPDVAPDPGDPDPYADPAAAVVAADVEPKKGFFSSRNGRLVLIAGAVAILLVVCGIAAALLIAVLGIFSGKPTVTITATPSATSTASSGTTVSPGAPAPEQSASATIAIAPITNADVYTVRDPFQPLIQQPMATATVEPSGDSTGSSGTTSTSGGGSSTSSSTAGDENTLTLLAVVTESGVRKGRFQVGSAIYVAGAGEQLGDTPWQVISVESNSAVVLYGDEQVTLVVGQEITK